MIQMLARSNFPLSKFFSNTFSEPKEIQDIRTEDDERFLAQSEEQLNNLEILRKEKLQIYLFRKKIGIPVAFVLTPILGWIDYWLLWLQSSNDNEAAGLSIIFIGGLYAWITSPKRQYAKEYKQRILPAIAKLFGDFTYTVGGSIPIGSMEPSKILPRHDRYTSEDHFRGKYKGVGIEFNEMTLKQRRRSGKKTHYVTVFSGLAILIDLKTKRFFGHTIMDKEQGKLGEWFKEKSLKMKRADLVDPEFEKIFDVYTNDQVEARYLIDPIMIEKLKGLYQEYKGEKMAVAFYESKMLILIASNHNHFEPADLHIPATDPQSVLSMKHEIGQILSLVDRLHLYNPDEIRK